LFPEAPVRLESRFGSSAPGFRLSEMQMGDRIEHVFDSWVRELPPQSTAPAGGTGSGGVLTAVRGFREQMSRAAAEGSLAQLSDADRVDLLRALEELACTTAGVQAVVTVDFDTSQRADQAAAGIPAERQGRGVAAQVALARRESPSLGARHLGLARILQTDLPHTRGALLAGRITEWRATLITRETAGLSVEYRALIDDQLAGTPERITRLEGCSDRRLIGDILHLAQTLDIEAVLERRRRAETSRRVTGRPAPDTMMYLTALLTARDGVAVLATLTAAANAANAAGDPRTRDQIMADLLVARLTGRDRLQGTTDVTINLIIKDSALFTDNPTDDNPAYQDATENTFDDPGDDLGDDDPGDTESAYLQDYGPIPAELAREIARQSLHQPDQNPADDAVRDTADGLVSPARVRWRRLYSGPGGALVGMESKARIFPPGLARLIRLRDHTCRTPWCNAPVRHLDHVIAHADGGPTTATNGQGLCAACNHTKQAPGWRSHPRPNPTGRHTVTTTTPTGHIYHSTAPPLAG
jgi:hypothetical protein